MRYLTMKTLLSDTSQRSRHERLFLFVSCAVSISRCRSLIASLRRYQPPLKPMNKIRVRMRYSGFMEVALYRLDSPYLLCRYDNPNPDEITSYPSPEGQRKAYTVLCTVFRNPKFSPLIMQTVVALILATRKSHLSSDHPYSAVVIMNALV